MIKKSRFLSPFLSFLLLPNLSYASVVTTTYSGNTGILETPNARTMPDWSMRMFINKDAPYTYYGFAAAPFPFLEANFHMTQIDGIAGFSDSDGYGDYKDKSLSFKLLLQQEGEIAPSVVFGGEDIWGTGLYTSKYLAFSKEIGYFDFTLGYAKGRLGGQVVSRSGTSSESTNNTAFAFMRNLDWGGGEPFGSAVFKATPDLSLMAEYSPIDYKNDKINPFTKGDHYELPDSKINYGLKYALSDNSTVGLSYQRGNQISFGYTYQFGFSNNGMFQREPDPKWRADTNKQLEYINLNEEQLSNKLANEVAAEKLANVKTSVNENKIWTEFDNTRYNSDIKAAGRAISTIDEVAPNDYDTIYATLKDKGVPIKTFKVNRQEYDAFENEKVSSDYMKNALILTNSVEEMEEEFKNGKEDVYKTDEYNDNSFTYKFGPTIKNYLNSKDKPFATKISAKAQIIFNPTAGFFGDTIIEHPIVNTITDLKNDSLESNTLSTRSQMLDYFKYDDTQLRKLSTGYMFRTPFDSLSKAEIGYFDYAFAGVDLEWYKSFMDDRFGFGLQYQNMYKRAVDDMTEIYNDLSFEGKFINMYTLLSEKYDLHLGVKYGQFLAGDKGFKIDFARHYKEFSLGAYATFTNSEEVFTNKENQGYIDKGIYIKVPLEVFTYKNVKSVLNYGLSPWTRDAGQYVGDTTNIYPMSNSENNIHIMKKNIQRFKE